MNDRDKAELELILFDDALRSVGLDFGFLKKAEKEAMKQSQRTRIIEGHLQSVGLIQNSQGTRWCRITVLHSYLFFQNLSQQHALFGTT